MSATFPTELSIEAFAAATSSVATVECECGECGVAFLTDPGTDVCPRCRRAA